ncbi:hypothetical protein CSHISOI_02054 [Colletotrichum shisoi]|uniref:GNAT family N-acetyltransferase n=1 Tax=Colletotrichum shisoi TaxID=2078593 RepID=A0A5Q4C2X7_9PEZI|nr:hypothetical protein CSHISOI_02054 [Colletotrichum shisoi]
MPAPSNLILEPVILEDVTALTEVCNQPPLARYASRAARWDGANRSDIVAKPFQRFVKVIGPNIADARGRARIAAWAK